MHIFINWNNNTHLYSYVACLLDYGVPSSKMLFFHDIKSYNSTIDKFQIVTEYPNLFRDIKDLDNSVIKDAKSIGFLSLGPKTAPKINKLIENSLKGDASKIYIILADNEINSWNKVYRIFGQLVPFRRYFLTNQMILVLSKVDRYFREKNPWGMILTKILGRKLWISNAIDFTPMKEFRKGLELISEERDVSTVRILLDSKPGSAKVIVKHLVKLSKAIKKINNNCNGITSIELGIWFNTSWSWFWKLNLKNRISILEKTAKQKQLNVQINFHEPVEIENYRKLISDYDYLFMRNRGGLGGAFEFTMVGGEVLFESKSINSIVFRNYFPSYNINSYTTSSLTKLWFKILTKNVKRNDSETSRIEFFRVAEERGLFYQNFYD